MQSSTQARQYTSGWDCGCIVSVAGHSLASYLNWNDERLFQLDPRVYLDTGEFVHLLSRWWRSALERWCFAQRVIAKESGDFWPIPCGPVCEASMAVFDPQTQQGCVRIQARYRGLRCGFMTPEPRRPIRVRNAASRSSFVGSTSSISGWA